MATRATHDWRICKSLHLLPPRANLCYEIPMARTPPLGQQALRSELVRRIGELSTYAETTCGPLTARDFAVTIVGFVLLPLFLVYLTWRMG